MTKLAELTSGNYLKSTDIKGREVSVTLSHITAEKMPDLDGPTLMERVHALRPGLPFVLVTAHATVEAAVSSSTSSRSDIPRARSSGSIFRRWSSKHWSKRSRQRVVRGL